MEAIDIPGTFHEQPSPTGSVYHENDSDPKLASLLAQERDRQEKTLNLIASENYAPQAVLQATGTVLTNKYAEGYPGKRYYGGCQIVDKVEELAIERCKLLFGADHANVQPHAGSQANMAVYLAMLNPGDTILGMSLTEGGHLTHGHPVNFSGKLFKAVHYTLNPDTELIDFEQIERLAEKHRPRMIIAGASAYSRTIDFARFAEIAKKYNALFLADIAHIAGLVATNLHPSPVGLADFVTSTTHKTLRGPRGGLILSSAGYGSVIDKATMPGMQGGPLMHTIAAKAAAFHLALQPEFKQYQLQVIRNAQALAQAFKQLGYRIVSGGTDNHLLVLDLRIQGINGKQAEQVLERLNIVVNRNCIPFDPQPAWITSGIRIGTPALTTRGLKEPQMIEVAQLIHDALHYHQNDVYQTAIKKQVEKLCATFPIYSK
jgi:glycine hydroxymethyltransferase